MPTADELARKAEHIARRVAAEQYRQWPDRSTLVGPWVAVDQETTDAE